MITGERCSIRSTSKHTGDAVLQTADFCFYSATCLPCMPSLTKRFYTVNRSKSSGLIWPALHQAHEQAGSGCSGSRSDPGQTWTRFKFMKASLNEDLPSYPYQALPAPSMATDYCGKNCCSIIDWNSRLKRCPTDSCSKTWQSFSKR